MESKLVFKDTTNQSSTGVQVVLANTDDNHAQLAVIDHDGNTAEACYSKEELIQFAHYLISIAKGM